MLSSRLVMVVGLAFLEVISVGAQTIIWSNSNPDFATGANWGGSVVPGPGDIATFTGTPTVQPTLNSNLSVSGLRFQGNVNLTGTGTLTIGASGLENLSPGNSTVATPLVFAGATSVIHNNDTLTISGPIANNTTSGLTANGLGATTIAGVISGGGKLIKAGTGAVTLSGANTFTGTTTIEFGTLAISTDANLGAAPASPSPAHLTLNGGTLRATSDSLLVLNANRGIQLGASGGTIEIGAGNSVLFGGVIAGSGELKVSGLDTLILEGSNIYTGPTRLMSGVLMVSHPNALGDATTGTIVQPGGSLQINNVTIAEPLTMEGVSTLSGIGTAGSTGPIGLAGNTTINANGTFTLSGVLSGTGSLTKTDTGSLVLSAANTFSGDTTISGGTLTLDHTFALHKSTLNYTGASGTLSFGSLTAATLGGLSGSKNLTLTNAATVPVVLSVGANNTQTTYSGVMSGAGSVMKTGFGTLILSGANTYTGGTVVTDGVLRLGANGALPTGGHVLVSPGSLSSGAGLELDGKTQTIGNLTFGGSNPGATAQVTLGTGGVLTLGGNLAYNAAGNPGPASISGGTLALSSDRTFHVAESFSAGPELTISSAINAPGVTLTKTGAGILELSGTSNHAMTVINDGALRLGASNVLPSSGAVVISQPAPGKLATLDIGSHSQTIGSLTFGGGTLTSASMVAISTTGTLTLGGNVVFDATNNPMPASISGGTLALGGATRTFNVGDSTSPSAFSDLMISAVVTGAGVGVTKTGPGTLLLEGANTYTGPTTVNAGRLQLGSFGSLSASSNVVVNTTVPGTTANFDFANATTAIGNLTFGGAGATSTSTNQVSGSGGTLTLTGTVTYDATNNPLGASISGSTLNLAGARTFAIGDSTNATVDLFVSSVVTGTGGIVKTGAGTMVLNNFSNSYEGATSIQQGVLSVASLSSLGSTSAGPIAIGNGTTGATLRYSGSGHSSTGRGLDLAGTTGGATLDVFSSGSIIIGGNITASGAGSKTLTLTGGGSSPNTLSGAIADNNTSEGHRTSILKTGFSTWILSGANTFTGGVTINGGTLRLVGTNTLGANTAANNVTIHASGGANTATLALNGSQQTISSLTFGGAGGSSLASNQVFLGAGGTLTLGGNISYDATSAPLGAVIALADPFGDNFPFGNATLALGGATRTFNVGDSVSAGHELAILANINGGPADGLIKTGAGALLLAGAGNYGGGTTVQTGSGALLLASSSNTAVVDGIEVITSGPVGKGTLTLQSGTTLATGRVFTSFGTFEDDVWLRNNVTISNDVTLGMAMSHSVLELAGTVTAADLSTRIRLGGFEPVHFSGTLTGSAANTALTIDSAGRTDNGGRFERGVALFSGSLESNIATLTLDRAAMVFGLGSSVSTSTTIKATNNGYVGIASDYSETPTLTPAALLARIDRPTFAGTFGFDTAPDSYYPHTFADALDLTGFGSGFTLGSLSGAILTGAITPAAGGYQFGNGGGTLIVRSNLGGAAPVSVNSATTIPENALAVIFQGNNTYTGSFTVTNSAAILDSANALPAGRSITLGANGYVGYTEAFTQTPTFAGFLDRIGSATSSSILGLDSHGFIHANTVGTDYSSYGRLITEPLDLRSLSRISISSIYLGTATNAVIAGRVIAPSSGTLSLAAISHGELGVRSSLRSGDVNSVVVGTAQPVHEPGMVVLGGRNTHAGGTTLLNGTLAFEGSSQLAPNGSILAGPLGTGTFTVGSGTARAQLVSTGDDYSDTVLHNNIALGSSLQIGFPDFFFGGEETNFAAEWSSSFSRLILHGIVSGAGGLEVFTDLVLNPINPANTGNSFTGGVTLRQGTLTLGHDTALGAAASTLTVSPFFSGGDSVPVGLNVTRPLTIANNIVFNGGTEYFEFGGRGSLTISGSVTLNGPLYLEIGNHPVTINGNVTTPSGGFGRLQLEGYAPLTLNGTGNTYNGGTEVDYGALIFGSAASIPAQPFTGLSAGWNGYIGLATPPANLQTGFIDRFSKPNTWGTIGFDTPATGSSPNVFAGPISLAGFNYDVRLGSASRAILSGPITPQGSTYYFGGGGGLLEVNSGLGNGPDNATRDLQVYSDTDAVLTLRLGSPVDGLGNPLGNTYTGGSTVGYASGLIFKQGAMPQTGSLYVYGNSYLGTEETDAAKVTDFLNRISTGFSGYPIIGFDSFSGTYALGSGFTWPTNDGVPVLLGPAFLGTATRANISAPLPLPAGYSTYRFAGFKGGQLTVSSVLINEAGKTNSVQIGDANNPATYRSPTEPNGPRSSVTLSAANTYTGGTTLSAGQLLVGHASALGTGTLTVDSGYYYEDLLLPNAALGAVTTTPTTGLTIANNITLYSPLTLVGLNNFTLSGSITNGSLPGFALSGSGYYEQMLQKVGSNTVTLSGNNTGFSGGIYIAEGGITFATANSVGTGPVLLGGPLGPTATFADNSTVNGISGDHASDQINVGSGKTLTINQPQDATYAGTFSGSSIALVYGGPVPSEPSQLRLTGASSYTGSNTINPGIVVVAGNNNALGASTNAVNLSGGVLAVEQSVIVSNPLTLNSGVLAGLGSFSPTAAIGIGTGVTLSPGPAREAGTLSFGAGGLNLLSGGRYVWSFADAMNPNGGWDRVAVGGPVAISVSSPTNPFTFKIEPAALDLIGGVANFNPALDNSWTVLTATSITGFTASSFFIDASALSGHMGIGSFSLSVIGGNALTLNFTAVPEPSTYALLGLGAIVMLMVSRRRKR